MEARLEFSQMAQLLLDFLAMADFSAWLRFSSTPRAWNWASQTKEKHGQAFIASIVQKERVL